MTSITLPSSGAAAIRLNGLGNGFLIIIRYAPLLTAIRLRDATPARWVTDPNPDLKVLIPSRERHASGLPQITSIERSVGVVVMTRNGHIGTSVHSTVLKPDHSSFQYRT
jgi:hypothetical protein